MELLPVLFLIPARGGSQRVPGKNLRTVAGVPLVARAVRTARAAARDIPGGPHTVLCSTDTAEIGDVARAWHAEVPFLRSPELATVDATSVDVAIDALDRIGPAGQRFRALVLVQPTSPLTEPMDLRRAVERFDATGHDVVSVTRSHEVRFHIGESGSAMDAAPSDPGRILSGAFYVVAPDRLRATRRFASPGSTVFQEVPADRAVDIDFETDFAIAAGLATARPVRAINVGGSSVGGGRCLVIAEAGVNHNGGIDMAHRLVDSAADAGADAVKFQTFDPYRLAAAGAATAEYQRVGKDDVGDQRALLAPLALPVEAWGALQTHARDRGLVFLSSPFDEGSADVLDRLDVPAFKVASGELTNVPFLEYLARKGRPLLISTGMADMREVADALDVIAASGDVPVALFHCVSSYPASVADANLRAMGNLRTAFGCPTGWSDHSLGIELPVAAVALGASLLEKHLTLDRTLPGPDHPASLDPTAFAAMVTAVRNVESALGDGVKIPTESEMETAGVARRSLHWARDLPARTMVTAVDMQVLRPGTGLPPARMREIEGARTSRSVRSGAAISPDDLE